MCIIPLTKGHEKECDSHHNIIPYLKFNGNIHQDRFDSLESCAVR
jgi:hypothetical protein